MLRVLTYRTLKHLARWLACEPDPCPWCPGDHEARWHYSLHDDR